MEQLVQSKQNKIEASSSGSSKYEHSIVTVIINHINNFIETCNFRNNFVQLTCFMEEEPKTHKCSKLTKKDSKLKLFLENKDGITSPNRVYNMSDLLKMTKLLYKINYLLSKNKRVVKSSI